MTNIDVYGVGNALVDKEFEVDEAFFTDYGIKKGVMTLVTQDRQDQLLKVLTDIYGIKKKSAGGSTGNTLYALSQFGGRTYFTCKVANDETGDFYLEQLDSYNVNTNITSREEGISGRCLVMISPDAERTMYTYLGISEKLSSEELNFEAARQSKYVYFESYLVTSPTAKSAITELKKFAEENNVKTAMTFSDPAMLKHFKKDVNDVLSEGVDLLFCNEMELLLWANTDSIEVGCNLMEEKARQFVITLGGNGALLFDGKDYISVESHKVKAIDTNGAGDMFAGAFLYGITDGLNFEAAGKLASLASAKVVSQFGPRLDPGQHIQIAKQQLATT